jgi:hypothetical protein
MDINTYRGLREAALLEILRVCRRKFASDPKDKLYAILGILEPDIRTDFRIDYSLSVKDVYTEIVDYLLKTTGRLDVICDAIYFPAHLRSAHLPSFVPDWSHATHISALGHRYKFSAARETRAACKFLDERLDRLQISAMYLDTIDIKGISVGSLCTLSDYLMSFLHWMSLLLAAFNTESANQLLALQDSFCKTLCLNQLPEQWKESDSWANGTFHVFVSLFHERLPLLPLPPLLQDFVDQDVDLGTETPREFLQKHFGDKMMGRCFCITDEKRLLGMGTGFMLPGDIVVVPFGCSTPVLLRQEGSKGEYRFVGDVYIHDYMYGLAIEEWKTKKREAQTYVIH